MPSVTVPAAVPTIQVSATPRIAIGPTQTQGAVFPGSDFIYLDKPKRKTCVLVYGPGGTGKTTFAVRWCPSPVALIAFDGRSEYAMELSKLAGRPVPYVPIHMPTASDILKMSNGQAMKIARESVDKVIRNFGIAVQQSTQGKVRTICLDTGTEFDRLLHIAFKGVVDEPARDHGRAKNQINQVWWQMFNDVRNAGNAHFVVLSRAGEAWEANEPTGEYYPKVNDVALDAVDWAGHIRIGRKRSPAPPPVAAPTDAAAVVGAGAPIAAVSVAPVVVVGGQRAASPFDPTAPQEFQMRITKAGNNSSERFKIYSESDWGSDGPFIYACTKLMPGSVPDDWR